MTEVSKRNYDTQQRRDMADKGEALPDGSFPIADKVDLGNALQSIGRAANRTIALAHIRRRAKALGAEDMLPDWAMTKSVVTPLSTALGVLLADSYSVYHEAHGFHWNVKGADFSQYHDLFSAITDDIYESIDPIAENMLKINADAPFRMTELASMRTIPESSPASDPQSMATALLAQIDGLLNTLKRTFDVAVSQNEQGIANFLSERIDSTQKWAWQLRASAGVQKADIIALERLRPFVDANEQQWTLMVNEVAKAGGIRQTTGYTAEMLAKAAQSFGGNRSAAGAYAASVRWGRRGGTSTAAGPKGGVMGDSAEPHRGIGARASDFPHYGDNQEMPTHLEIRDKVIGGAPAEYKRVLPKTDDSFPRGIDRDGVGNYVNQRQNPVTTAGKVQAGDRLLLQVSEGNDHRWTAHTVTKVTRHSGGGVLVHATTRDWKGNITEHKMVFHPKDKVNVKPKGHKGKIFDVFGNIERGFSGKMD
jgi:starvation-inducible DNA-binding protein